MPLSRLFADDIRALREDATGLVAHPERERVGRLAERAARSALPVLVESEPGSGAQALAGAIHDCSERASRPFIRLHAGEPPDRKDAEPILSGIRAAHGGTLLIQEVERLGSADQGHLLDCLHRRDARRHDVQIISSSGFDLAGLVREGRFREDLYYRLQALPISLRPLRAQRDAVAEWAHRLMSRFAADEGKRIRGLSTDAASLLARYDWPGNLRQLENAVYRAVLLAEGPFLTATEFPQIAARLQGQRIEIPPVPAPRPLAPYRETEPAERAAPHALSLINDTGEMLTLADLEAQAIRFALLHYQGHMSAISRHLGIGRSTLYRKLKELGLDDEAA
ncbi:sigma-54-dependent transcriptional regulator [Microvirga aerilata]|uniref:sigma-54-dependent transcriptional regulator n=1 Tax=Microvirga aerilata TaxID=670292 RepID=UPI0036386009